MKLNKSESNIYNHLISLFIYKDNNWEIINEDDKCVSHRESIRNVSKKLMNITNTMIDVYKDEYYIYLELINNNYIFIENGSYKDNKFFLLYIPKILSKKQLELIKAIKEVIPQNELYISTSVNDVLISLNRNIEQNLMIKIKSV